MCYPWDWSLEWGIIYYDWLSGVMVLFTVHFLYFMML